LLSKYRKISKKYEPLRHVVRNHQNFWP
jgi:hypothetical protein